MEEQFGAHDGSQFGRTLAMQEGMANDWVA